MVFVDFALEDAGTSSSAASSTRRLLGYTTYKMALPRARGCSWPSKSWSAVR